MFDRPHTLPTSPASTTAWGARKRLRLSVIAATLLAGGLFGTAAQAVALGRMAVQSALGQPLRAEVELPQLTAEEAQSLRVTIGSPALYTQSKLEYNPIVRNVRVSEVVRGANGGSVLRLTSDQPITEPFIDVVLDAQWATGRVVRGYSVLLDPASTPAPVGVQPAQVAPVAAAPAIPPAPAPVPAPVTAPPAPVEQAVVREPRKAVRKAARSGARSAGRITVKPGDTAGQIAQAAKAQGVSLDQMLVAMLRANPKAFIGGDINRVRAGAVLNLPSKQAALAVPRSQARQEILASSQNFGQYRRKLAEHSPARVSEAPATSSSGAVQTQVQDAAPAASAPDKLTLTKGSVQGQKAGATVETKVADQLRQQDQASRDAELKRNLDDLAKLQAAAGTAPSAAAPASAASSALAPVVPVTAPVVAAPVASAPAPVAAASKPKITAAPTPPIAEPSFLDSVTDNPLLPVAGAGLLGLLGAYAWQKSRQRKQREAEELAALGGATSLQSDSFFTSSGGQHVNTKEGGDSTLSGSSMSFSPSQLDAGDVDAVAEADVYIGYGRDLQAEEILREALTTQPDRLAIHSKLLDIYAKRADAKAFQVHAQEVKRLTQGRGVEWQRVCAMGNSIDPGHPMYRVDTAAPAAVAAATALATAAVVAPAAAPAPKMPDSIANLDLTLDSSFSSFPASTSGKPSVPPATQPVSAPVAPASPVPPAPAVTAAGSLPPSLNFDLGDLSLQPTTPAPAPVAAGASAVNDPFATKLGLAEAFADMGETQGARDLAKEVLANGSDAQKVKAQQLIDRLG